MKKIALLTLSFCLTITAIAQRVTINDATSAGRNFLSINEPSLAATPLSTAATLSDTTDNPVMYILNIGNTGFIIVGADKHFPPIVGYSLNGAYVDTLAAPALRQWLAAYVADVQALRQCAATPKAIASQQPSWQREWTALEKCDAAYYAAKGGKDVNALVTTYWNQGPGYNNLCPQYPSGFNGSNWNGRSYTGCVATAMAQIIRYHQYPSHGFTSHGYTHYAYGYLEVCYDSATYNYSKMPSTVSSSSNQSYQNAVSQLCYHCGVAVDMDYENPNHTSGSGAQSSSVPGAFKFFGYPKAVYVAKNASINWDSLLRHDLNLGRPVYYSGASSEGGHAFICDGFRNSSSLYHFNFGWGGYTDGFYTISNLNGYSSSQAAVVNIYPSNLTVHPDTIFMEPGGTGSGTSWNDTYGDLDAALQISSLYKRTTIWLKNGTYYGDTSSSAAFTIQKGVSIVGGFAGTESSADERTIDNTATVLSGKGKTRVLLSPVGATGSSVCNVTFADGYADNGAGAYVNNGTAIEQCIFRDNTSTDPQGAALYANANNNICRNIFHNNNGGAVALTSSKMSGCLVAHNDGYGVKANKSTVDCSDIVCNTATGIVNSSDSKVRNCILWRNGATLSDTASNLITYSAIEGFQPDTNGNIDISRVNRPDDTIGPFFIDPDTTNGPSDNLGDWHLSSRSPLVNAGDPIGSRYYAYDLDGNARVRSGRIDIGCYEWIPGNSILDPSDLADPSNLSNLSNLSDLSDLTLTVFPNPATTTLTVESPYNSPIEIFDLLGHKLLSTTATPTTTTTTANTSATTTTTTTKSTTTTATSTTTTATTATPTTTTTTANTTTTTAPTTATGSVATAAHTTTTTTIDISHLPNGLYILRSATLSAKFLKQ